MIQPTEDEFEISENKVAGLSGKLVGERIRGIINCEVIEKTRSYTMVRVRFMTMMPTKRLF